jgi:hypothetical protein
VIETKTSSVYRLLAPNGPEAVRKDIAFKHVAQVSNPGQPIGRWQYARFLRTIRGRVQVHFFLPHGAEDVTQVARAAAGDGARDSAIGVGGDLDAAALTLPHRRRLAH